MTSPWEPMKPRLHRSRHGATGLTLEATGTKAQSNQWHKARPTMADWHQSLPPHPTATCLPLTDPLMIRQLQWKMMHRFKFQDGRNQDLTLTNHPNPCMGFHCQTCEHFGNGGAWGWNIFSNYFKLWFGCVQSHHWSEHYRALLHRQTSQWNPSHSECILRFMLTL